MPYSGVTDSEVNAKIDRCVQTVMKTGKGKSAAVAICRAAIPGAMTRKEHDYQSTQFDMPPHIAERIQLFQRIFAPEDLTDKGIETDPHVTIFYGLTSATPEQIAEVAKDFRAVKLNFGEIAVFENPEFDVVVVEVEGGKLRELNARLSELPNENEWRVFNPHLTLAYVKPGYGQKYLINPLDGMSVTFDQLKFCDRDGSKVSIPLGLEQPSEIISSKAESDAPNYRDAGPSNLNVCETCRFSAAGRRCTKYDFRYRNGWTCDAWRPNIDATKRRHQELNKMDKAASTFKVFKAADGSYRWLSISSTAYQDRDGEYVSLKALKADVERADNDGNYGPLRFWHEEGWDIGDATFNMIVGKSLIEGGTFRRKEYAESLMSKPPAGMSIGYYHPKSEPDTNGVFHNIRRFERSVLPASATPSNRFTTFVSLKENDMATREEKLKALFEQFQDGAKGILTEAAQTDAKAAKEGVSYKSHDDLSKLSADELLLYALDMKDAETEEPTPAADPEPEPEEPAAEADDQPAEGDAPLTAKEFQAAMSGFAETLATSLKSAITGQPAPAPDRKKEIDAAAQQIETTKSKVDRLEAALKEAQAKLKELEGEQPSAVKGGYRASQKAQPVKDEEAVKAAKEAQAADPWGLGTVQEQLGVGWPGQNGQ